MSKQVKTRGGSAAQHTAFIGAARELTVDTDNNRVIVHDGMTAGGHPLAKLDDISALSTALQPADIGVTVASKAQGDKADTALQPGDSASALGGVSAFGEQFIAATDSDAALALLPIGTQSSVTDLESGKIALVDYVQPRAAVFPSFMFPPVISGTGTTYYVSAAGNDSNAGTSTATPWATVAKVNSVTFSPGDKILFRRGDSWSAMLQASAAGVEGNLITYGAYGDGALPIITTAASTAYNQAVFNSNPWVRFDSLHIISGVNSVGTGHGVAFSVAAHDCMVTNCVIENGGRFLTDGVYSLAAGAGFLVSHCEVKGYHVGMLVVSGGTPGKIKCCYVHDLGVNDLVGGDGIRVIGPGDYTGFIVEDCEVTGWSQDAVDLYNASNVTVNRVYVHKPRQGNAGNGLKMGGPSSTGNKATNCWVEALYGVSEGNGFVTNVGTAVEVTSCVFWNCVLGMFVCANDNNTVMRNNISIANTSGGLHIAGPTTGSVVEDNLIDGTTYAFTLDSTAQASGARNFYMGGANRIYGTYASTTDSFLTGDSADIMRAKYLAAAMANRDAYLNVWRWYK